MFALLAPLARGRDILGRTDVGNNLLISNPTYITTFYGYVKLCSYWGVDSEKFIFHLAHTEDPVFQSPNWALTLQISTQLYRQSMLSAVLLIFTPQVVTPQVERKKGK